MAKARNTLNVENFMPHVASATFMNGTSLILCSPGGFWKKQGLKYLVVRSLCTYFIYFMVIAI